MIHAALFCLIVLAAASHGIMDAIKDLRTHLARHAYKDFWHAMQHIRVASLLLAGYVSPISWRADVWAFAICAGCGLVIGRMVWERVYACPDYWLAVDETLKIGTGWKWFDKLCGFHW